VLHIRKLGQQRKIVNDNKCSNLAKYSKSRDNTLSFDTTHKHVHSIDSDGCGAPKNWEKNVRPPQSESESRTNNPRRDYHQPRGGYSSRGQGRGQDQDRPLYCMFHERDTDHRIRDCPIFLESKNKMTQKHN
jgi:hypothetical protein